MEATGDIPASPLALPAVDGALEPTTGSGLLAGDARPLLRLKLAGAEALATCGGSPVVTRYRLGKGQVWLSADPVELGVEMIPAHRALYRAFLQAAGAPILNALPDRPDLQVFRIPGEDADAWVLRNGGPAADVQVAGFTVHLAAQGTGFLLVGRDGSLRVVECQGAVRRGGKEIARIAGHAFLVAEDDRDLTRSRQLLALPLSPGEIRLTSALPPKTTAEVGEMRDGKWRVLERIGIGAADGRLRIPVTAANNREMIRVAALPGSRAAR